MTKVIFGQFGQSEEFSPLQIPHLLPPFLLSMPSPSLMCVMKLCHPSSPLSSASQLSDYPPPLLPTALGAGDNSPASHEIHRGISNVHQLMPVDGTPSLRSDTQLDSRPRDGAPGDGTPYLRGIDPTAYGLVGDLTGSRHLGGKCEPRPIVSDLMITRNGT